LQRVHVSLFAGMAEAAGRRSLDVAWRGGSVAELRRAVAEAVPAVALLVARSAVATRPTASRWRPARSWRSSPR